MQPAEQHQGVIKGTKPDPTDVFYAEWGDELIKRNLTFLNDVLRQLVTLSTAMLSGSIIFLNDAMISRGLKLATIAMFLCALVIPHAFAAHHSGLSAAVMANILPT